MDFYIKKNKQIYNKKYNQNLTFWDFLFWQNFPLQINDKNQIANIIKNASKTKLEELKQLNTSAFKIDANENNAIDLLVHGILKTAIESKDLTYAEQIQKNINEFKNIQAFTLSISNYESYKKLIQRLENNNYPETFQCLILNEFLNKLYKFETKNNITKVEQQPRKLNKSIFGLIDLSEFQLEFIYNNAENFSKNQLNFSDLYLQSYEKYKQYIENNLKEFIILSKNKNQNKVNKILNYFKKDLTTDVDTLGQGMWLKFGSVKHDPENYIKNSECVSKLLYNTNNCLKNNAQSYLADGNIYIFVDNKNNARIIITMLNNKIWEVRGIDGGQEIQKDYIDVALKFLEQNHQKNQYWYRRIETNKQLIEYKEQLKNNNFNFDNFEELLIKMASFDRYSIEGDNPNLVEIKELIPNFSKNIAQIYKCNKDEILFGKFDYTNIDKIDFNKIKIILGEVDFSKTSVKDLGSIEFIYKANFKDSQIENFGNLNKCIVANKECKQLPKKTQILATEVFNEQIIIM